jgi:arylsulfatase A-like enzyme
MKRIVHHAIILIPWILTLLTAGSSGAPGKNDPGKPNFVWIVSEDNSSHYMKLFDEGGIATPQIEAMAEKGIVFTRAFSNAPVCSVARSSLISSCYAPRTGTQFHRKLEPVPMPDGLQMFPVYLRRAGYYTTNNSKEDYNYLKSEGTWDESSTSAHWSHRAPGQPFFHMESHPETHESRLHFGPELMDTYKPVTDPAEVRLFPQHPDTELFRFTAAYYMDRVLSVDTIVGRVIRQLEEEGLLEDTFVFYFSDHGGVLPGSKGYIYETGLHVPLVVRIPAHFRHLVGQERGSRSGCFVSFIDFGPTLLELAGVPLPSGIDGIPFLGTSHGDQYMEHQKSTFGYADRFDEKYDLVRSVRKGTMKYIRSFQPFNFDALQNNYRYQCMAYRQWRKMYNAGALDSVQSRFFETREPEALYDLEKDPFETKNLAGIPGYREELSEMRGLLSEWIREMPDLSFYPENILRREAFKNPTGFGQTHHDQIGELIDIADLSLLPFEEAMDGTDKALHSGESLKIYWGLIVCSSFGKDAEAYVEIARKLCTHEDLLVRTRAAEFLGLTGAADPVPVISGALIETSDPLEALLILNSLVLLMDGKGYHFPIREQDIAPVVRRDAEVGRRLDYIRARSEQSKKM